MDNNRVVGYKYEGIAERFITDKGLKVLNRNYRVRIGEIDLIAIDKDSDSTSDVIVFIEIKYRKNPSFGYGFEAVNKSKQIKIRNVAKIYLCEKGLYDISEVRFDVISITGDKIDWIKDAF